MNYSDIIGNLDAKEYLSKTVNWNNILHSYLFLETSGIGKKLIAKAFAKKILCLNEKKDDNCFKGKRKDGKNILTKYMYVDIDSVMVKQLRNVTKKLQPNTGKEKEYKYFLLKSRLEEFKIKHDIS